MSRSNIDDSIPGSTDVNMSITCIEVSMITSMKIFEFNLCSHIHTVPHKEVKGTERNNHAKLNSTPDLTYSHESKGGQYLTPETDPRLVNEQCDLGCLIDCHQADRRYRVEGVAFPSH